VRKALVAYYINKDIGFERFTELGKIIAFTKKKIAK